MGNDFTVKKILDSNIEQELIKIGFDNSYVHIGAKKYEYLNLKIFDLSLPQANILKQTALTVGADCAVHRGIYRTNKMAKTRCYAMPNNEKRACSNIDLAR